MTPVKEAAFLLEWLQTKSPKELEVFTEELPKVFSGGDFHVMEALLNDDKKSAEWRERLLDGIWKYFETKGSKKKHFTWHKKYLSKCFDKVFSQNKFFSKVGANWQWGIYVMGWFLMMIADANEPGYCARPLSHEDTLHTYV